MMNLVRQYEKSLQFAPGSKWQYSNTGMLVLGKVIEIVSGQSYYNYVREHIYKPAGMTNTDSYELDKVNTNLCFGVNTRKCADYSQITSVTVKPSLVNFSRIKIQLPETAIAQVSCPCICTNGTVPTLFPRIKMPSNLLLKGTFSEVSKVH